MAGSRPVLLAAMFALTFLVGFQFGSYRARLSPSSFVSFPNTQAEGLRGATDELLTSSSSSSSTSNNNPTLPPHAPKNPPSAPALIPKPRAPSSSLSSSSTSSKGKPPRPHTTTIRDEALKFCKKNGPTALLRHFSCEDLPPSSSSSSSSSMFVFPTPPPAEHEMEKIFSSSMRPLCKDAELSRIINVTLTCRFLPNYLRHYDETGWANNAFLSYVKSPPTTTKYLAMAETLVASAHLMSTTPVVLVCIDSMEICEKLNVTKYPNLVMLHMSQTALSQGRYLDYYKWLGMAVSRIRTGIELDADQIVLWGVDDMFERVRVHTNAAYPYPIMPVHWMSRDPAGGDYEVYQFKEDLSFNRSMRWNHAHPTWTYHAIPFLATMYKRTMQGDKLKTYWSDEDIANVLSWELKLTKQWCKFDNFVGEIENFLKQSPDSYGPNHMADKKWFPEGVPVFFTTLHNAKNPKEDMEIVNLAVKRGPQKYMYYWKGKWMHRGELEKMNPPCVV